MLGSAASAKPPAVPALAAGAAAVAQKVEAAQVASMPDSENAWSLLRSKAWVAAAVLLSGVLIGMGIAYLAYRA
jgi:ABC-type Fe3+ transport system permease subunit